MPISDKMFNHLAERVDGIDSRLRSAELWSGYIKGALSVLLLLLPLVGWMLFELNSLDKSLAALKQSMSDHGQAIIAQVANPSSPARLTAALAQVSADAKLAIATNRPQNQIAIGSAVAAVEKATTRDPDLAEAWDAAASVANYRYLTVAQELPDKMADCNQTMVDRSNSDVLSSAEPGNADKKIVPGFTEDRSSPWVSHEFLGYCTLSIDDRPDFFETPIGKFFARVKEHHPQLSQTYLVLNHVRIVYHGGAIIPVTGLELTDCAIDLQVPQSPPARGKALTTQFLATNISKSTISLPG